MISDLGSRGFWSIVLSSIDLYPSWDATVAGACGGGSFYSRQEVERGGFWGSGRTFKVTPNGLTPMARPCLLNILLPLLKYH